MRRLIMLLSIAGCTALPAAAQFSDSISCMDPRGRKVSTKKMAVVQ